MVKLLLQLGMDLLLSFACNFSFTFYSDSAVPKLAALYARVVEISVIW